MQRPGVLSAPAVLYGMPGQVVPPAPPPLPPPVMDRATQSLQGRELPEDLVSRVSDLTMGQLFYILSHIQKLTSQAPVTAQALLAENPQICYALLHAECLAGMVEGQFLPMSSMELQKAKETARQMQEELAEHELPPPDPSTVKVLGSTPKSESMGYSAVRKAPAEARPSPYPVAAMPPIAGYAGIPPAAPPPRGADDRTHLMQRLVQLTPDQIARLPEATKVQLLQFLQSNQQQS